MEKKHPYVNLFTGIFFVFFFLTLVGYVSYLRTEKEQEARRILHSLVEKGTAALRGSDVESFFLTLEGLPFPPQAILILDQNNPLVFWGDQQLTTWDSTGLGLQTLSLEQERISLNTPTGLTYQGIFRLLGEREYFLVSRLGFIMLSGYFVLVLLAFFISQRKKPGFADMKNDLIVRHNEKQETPTHVNLKDSEQVSTQLAEPLHQKESTIQDTSVSKGKQPELGEIEFLVYTRNVLDERLSGELHRAGSNQLDLSLGLIKGEEGISEIELLTALREYFIYKDVLYREDSGMCWVMFPQMGLDEAVRETQRFILGVKKKWVLGDHRTEGRGVPKISSGLSSRNGRILGSARLIKEAKEALKKTDQESPVVGFRSDPDQYRQFILRKNSK